MPGKKISLIGASNLYTNNTCNYGSMAGLAPTTNVRPNVSGLNGYKYNSIAANGTNWATGSILAKDSTSKGKGCGLGKLGQNACDEGKRCLQHLDLWKGTKLGHDPVRGKLLS